ncbi:MAG: hypothetical protein JWN15_1713 [Firmicutes bacterium]|nr:hypothetical protein [Bacillota bacterium]
MRPTLRLRAVTAPPSDPGVPLAALRLRRSLAWPVGQAEAECSLSVQPPDAGAKVVIEGAADGDSLKPLFTGRVLRRAQGLWGISLLIEEATGPLTRLHLDKAVSAGTAAQVVGDLCQAAGVEAAVEPPGAQLPSRVLLSNRSAMDHILRLAQMSGWLLRTDTGGKLHAGMPPLAPAGVVLRPQDPVLELRVADDPDEPAGGAITGDGALGVGGPGAESWLLQSLSGISGGDGLPALHLPGLKLMADVTKAATMESLRLRESRFGRTVTLAGIPQADIGEVILLLGFGGGDGPARVVGLEVLWSAEEGLISRLDLQGLGA